MTNVKPVLNPLSLKRNFSWSLLGNLVYGICQIGTLAAIAKLGTPEMLGQFTLGIAIVTPISLLFNLNLRAIQATDSQHRYQFGEFFGLRLVTNFLAWLLTLIAVFSAGYHPNTIIIVVLLASCKVIDYFSDLFYGLWQQYERLDKVAQSTILRSVLSLLLLSISLWATRDLFWATISYLGASLLTVLLYDLPTTVILVQQRFQLDRTQQAIEQLRPQFSRLKLWQLTKLSLPVGLSWMMLSLSTNVPRYVIERVLGDYELGIFSAIAYLPISGLTLVFALGQASLTRLSKYYSTGEWLAFQKLLMRLIAVVFGLGSTGLMIAILFGRVILAVTYRSEYAEQATVLVLLMIWAVIHYTAWCLDYAATAARRFHDSLKISALKLGCITIASVLFIPRYGIMGAAIALLIDSVIQLFGMSAIIWNAIQQLKQLTQSHRNDEANHSVRS